MGGGPPALVSLDLLLDVLTVGALGSLLGHGHQLDQLRPGVGAGERGEDDRKAAGLCSDTGGACLPPPWVLGL